MHLGPTAAQIFIDGYKHVLSMIHSLSFPSPARLRVAPAGPLRQD
jgi:hypothetical protein